jgi:thymidylate synthase (FAD)
MAEVKLISWSGGGVSDVRRLILLAIKVSAGKVKEKGVEYYLRQYPEEKLSEWVRAAVAFPSVLEHVCFTFLVEDISRVTSHQLVRHRIASFTQESQRYSAAEGGYVIPEKVREGGFEERFVELIREARKLYDEMVSSGIPYEDARYILPQAVKTRLVMTVNLRELIHISCLRGSSAAQWEIRELVGKMVKETSRVLPEIEELVREGCRRGI